MYGVKLQCPSVDSIIIKLAYYWFIIEREAFVQGSYLVDCYSSNSSG